MHLKHRYIRKIHLTFSYRFSLLSGDHYLEMKSSKFATADVNQASHDTKWNEVQTCEAIETYRIFWRKKTTLTKTKTKTKNKNN